MKLQQVFDLEEKIAGGHQASFELLSDQKKMALQFLQWIIAACVVLYNGGKFKATSGWRAQGVNTAIGGKFDSLHLVGMARDYVSTDSGYLDPPRVPFFLQVLKSPKNWHIQFRLCRSSVLRMFWGEK